jgi:hypothetical protein
MPINNIGDEERARLLLERVLGRPVAKHDDGSQPSMYDFRVGPPHAPEIAIECVGAVDAQRTETWNVGPAKGPESLNLRGDWYVVLQTTANVKAVRREIQRVLGRCEALGMVGFTPVDWFLRRNQPEIYESLSSLRIETINCTRTVGTGRLDLGMTGIGGAVDEEGRALPGWVGEFLRHPDRADVVNKLVASAAPNCQVFIPVSYGAVPWHVESYLGAATEIVPKIAPDLPAPVTAVWLTYGTRGILWSRTKWVLFDASLSPRL